MRAHSIIIPVVVLGLAGVARAQDDGDDLEMMATQNARAQATGAARVGDFLRGDVEGKGKKSDYQVLLEGNKCYWFSGASEGVNKLYLYLWPPNAGTFTRRVADAKAAGGAVTMAYCAPDGGLYHLQVKTEGDGRFVVGTFAKEAPKQVEKPGLDLGAICDKTAHTASPRAKRTGDFFDGKGSSWGHDDRSDYTVEMDKGRCYWIVGCGEPDHVKSLYLYLWGPDNKRITEARSDSPNPMVGHCPTESGMFKVQAKMNGGSGAYKVGIYVK